MRKPALMFFSWLWVFIAFAQPDTIQRINPDRVNSLSQQQKPYVIMISCDGFRYDYVTKHGAKHILALSEKGVRSQSMIPCFPSLTFPNHYSIVTGLYPSQHGLVSNYFYDRTKQESYEMNKSKKVTDSSWYGGTPLWVLAEQQQMLTADFFWVGSEAAIKGVRPTYYYKYNDAFSNNRRIEIILNWLQLPEERRPHLITVYFPQLDHAGHDFGPDAPQTKAALQELDDVIYQLIRVVKSTGLPVNYILVSDHGMTKVDVEHPVPLPDIDSSKFIVPRGRELMMIYARQQEYIQPTYEKLKAAAKNYKVYLKDDLPAYLRYGKADDHYNRVGDILLIPDWPRIFQDKNAKPKLGAHGFDPVAVKDMQTIFYAWGPSFKAGITVSSFQNVDVFPVVTSVLGLVYDQPIDGSRQLAEKIIK